MSKQIILANKLIDLATEVYDDTTIPNRELIIEQLSDLANFVLDEWNETQLTEQEKTLVRGNQWIYAVKSVKERCKLNLKQAVDLVRDWERENMKKCRSCDRMIVNTINFCSRCAGV